MSQAIVEKKSTGTRVALGVLDVVLWGAVAACGVHVWSVLTGTTLVPRWVVSDAWVPASALIQVNQLELVLTEEDPGRSEITLFPWWLRAVGASSFVLFTAMLVTVLRAARLIAARVMSLDPFSADIPRRLRHTTVVVLVLAVARLLVDLAVISHLMTWQPTTATFHSLHVNLNPPSLSLSLVLAAIVAWVLAVAFERGARLEREAEGLV